METKASLKFARIGAQKARLVADLVRGLQVSEAVKSLAFVDKKAAVLIKKVVESAIANADHSKAVNVDRLYVKAISIDQGPSLKRFRPRAQGRAYGIRKKTSHINIVLDER